MSEGRPVAVVTGGNRGIGFEICRKLGEAGYHVLLCARDEPSGSQAASGLREEGHEAQFFPLDVTSAESVEFLVRCVADELGRVDALVNNAGIYPDEGVAGLDVSVETARETMDTNAFGPLRLCQALAPFMRRRGYGRIVNVSSGYGKMEEMERGGVLAYKLSKLALNAVTRILADELRGTGVLVNAMDPGWVRTRMGGPSAPRTPAQAADTALWLATLPEGGPTGGFFYDRRPTGW
jgi:NAD(P)-dependent dehydrogenase (short-subunit alcohol dehydrogenase family)